MRILRQLRLGTLLGLAVAIALVTVGVDSAQARLNYWKSFEKQYPEVKKENKLKGKSRCTVCHYGKSKKKRNDYGVSLTKHLGKKKIKDKDKIKEAFKKAEKDKSATKGKTFGDLLKDKKLPGTAPKKDK